MGRLPHFYGQSVWGGVPELIGPKNPSPLREFSQLTKDPNGNNKPRNHVHCMGTSSHIPLSHTIRKLLNSYKFFQKTEKTKKWPSRPPTFTVSP